MKFTSLLIILTTAASFVHATSELALIFTGGPDGTHTAKLLDTLKAKKAKATFLFQGNLLNNAARKALALRAKNEGHSVGHLGFASTDFTKMSGSQLAADLQSANTAVKAATGVQPIYVGYPRSNTNAAVDAAITQKGLKPVIWNFDSKDWSSPTTSGKGAVRVAYVYQLEEADPQNWSILVDMHDNQTIYPLMGEIVQIIKSAPNLVAVNMDDCYKGVTPAASPISRCANGQIALTFDDGPYVGLTDKLLDELKKTETKTTFFVLGSVFDGKAAESAILKRAFDEGHTIGSHSWSHPDFTTLTVAQMKTEITKTSDAIKKVIGKPPTFFRFPYNAYNDESFNTVKSMGYNVVEWNGDPEDFIFANPTDPLYDPQQVTSYFKRILQKRIGVRTNAVNSGTTDSTVAALADIIAEAAVTEFTLVNTF